MKILITQNGETFFIWLQNGMCQRLMFTDSAHMGLRLRTEVEARVDVIRVALCMPKSAVVWECDKQTEAVDA
jgi:hypothetical protein